MFIKAPTNKTGLLSVINLISGKKRKKKRIAPKDGVMLLSTLNSAFHRQVTHLVNAMFILITLCN